MNKLPPGPKKLSSIHFFQSGLTPSVAVLKKLRQQYGDPFRVEYLSGPLTFTGHPEALKQIYSADPSVFDVWGTDVIAPLFGRTSVVVSAGDRHRRDRKLLTPAFSGATLRSYAPLMEELVEDAVRDWKPGHRFSMLELTQELTLDIMVRVVFGVDDRERIRRTRVAVMELIESLHPIIFLFPRLRRQFGGHGPWARFTRAVDKLNEHLLHEVRERRKNPPTGRNDILSLMMLSKYDDGSVLSDDEILEQMRGLLFAGHEATSIVLAWIFYWLCKEPAILEKVLAEIDDLGPNPSADDFSRLPYLEAVCFEALRMYPPVVDPARRTAKELQIMDYTIPVGEGVRPSLSLLHTREDLYPEPERFRPERFLERKFSPFEFIPFGGGIRRCLGAAFSMYEMKVLLGCLVRSYRLRLESPDEITVMRRCLTLGPSNGVPMVCEGPRVVSTKPRAVKAPTEGQGEKDAVPMACPVTSPAPSKEATNTPVAACPVAH